MIMIKLNSFTCTWLTCTYFTCTWFTCTYFTCTWFTCIHFTCIYFICVYFTLIHMCVQWMCDWYAYISHVFDSHAHISHPLNSHVRAVNAYCTHTHIYIRIYVCDRWLEVLVFLCILKHSDRWIQRITDWYRTWLLWTWIVPMTVGLSTKIRQCIEVRSN
jgi:hypothetical protein